MLRDGLFVNRVQANLNCHFHPAFAFLPVLIIVQKDNFLLCSWGVFKVCRLYDKFQICWGYSISTCDAFNCEYWHYLLSSPLCLMMPHYFAFLFAGLAIFGAEASLLICSYVPYCFPFPDVPVSSFVTLTIALPDSPMLLQLAGCTLCHWCLLCSLSCNMWGRYILNSKCFFLLFIIIHIQNAHYIFILIHIRNTH
jgi:hypothetical protein